jgi:lactose/cellobiose-specific phosphotransferase system IIC component
MLTSKRIFDSIYTLTAPGWAFCPTMQAIRNGFLLCMPLVAAGALAILINNLPIPAYQEAMTALFGSNWRRFGMLIWQGTYGIISVPMIIGVSSHLIVLHNRKDPAHPISPVMVVLVVLASLVVIIPSDETAGFAAEWLGVQGLFVSIIVAIAATQIFLRLTRIKWLQIAVYSEGTDAATLVVFAYLLPGVLTITLFSGFYLLFHVITDVSIYRFTNDLVLFPFKHLILQQDGNQFSTSLLYVFVVQSIWFFGIHATNILASINAEIFQTASAEGSIFTKEFLDIFVFMGGSGSSICLLISLLLVSSNHGSCRLAKISALPGIFNINEILLFGLPVILNPIFLIPFIATPIILTLNSYLAVHYGFVPRPSVVLNWTTPPIIGGYFATAGSVSGSLLQCFNLVIGTLIYTPFVMIADRVKQQRQKMTMNELMDIACSNTVSPSGKKCLDRDDEIGSLARSLAGDLERALKRGQGLYLEYQPQVDNRTGEVLGTEALVRWRHPVYGLIPPPIMVAISEDGDFMKPLGLWVLEEACAERARWKSLGVDDHFKTSVNVSIRQLDDPHLPEKVVQCLQRHQLESYMIGIEVTESIALDPEGPHNRILDKIHSHGIAVSIDDFGMGHSSLIYLKYFPVSALKIDKALSKDVASSHICAEIISTIVDLCRSLDVKIVVEFVENQGQIDVLRRLGCYIYQGYFYSPPLSAEKMLKFALDKNHAAQPEGEDYVFI